MGAALGQTAQGQVAGRHLAPFADVTPFVPVGRPSYADAVLRLVGALLVALVFASGANAQSTFQMEEEPEDKPLVTPPKLVRFVEADYPETEGEAQAEVGVELDIVVGKDGLVTEVSVARSGGEAFDEAALAAARQFVFEPARKDWEPVAARIRYRYVFELKAPPEELTTGWLKGTVLLAEDDSPAGAVAVEIVNDRGELVRDLVAGPDGTFVATALEPGKYKVHIAGGEYGDLRAREELSAGQVTRVAPPRLLADNAGRKRCT